MTTTSDHHRLTAEGDDDARAASTGLRAIALATGTAAERALATTMRANAISSGLFGLVGAVGAAYWSQTLGIDHVGITVAVSLGLILFAADTWRIARHTGRRLATGSLITSIADLAWVGASIVVVALGLLTTVGTIAALAVAAGVLDFALVQLWFRRRMVRG